MVKLIWQMGNSNGVQLLMLSVPWTNLFFVNKLFRNAGIQRALIFRALSFCVHLDESS